MDQQDYDYVKDDLLWCPPNDDPPIPLDQMVDSRLINSINLINRRVGNGTANDTFMRKWGDLLPAMMAEAKHRGISHQISSTKT